MPERCEAGSISRTLLLPQKQHLNSTALGTFRLRYLLAEDGCKESQLSLAKSLLTVSSDSFEERIFNAQLAIYWLLQAAKRGQNEAILLLKECAGSGVGINAINSAEVEKYLQLNESEILSRRITFRIFHAIMSDTEEQIPETTFQKKIECVLTDKIEEDKPYKKTVQSSGISDQSQQIKGEEANLRNQAHVSFSEIVNSVQSCLEGNAPLISLKQVTEYQNYFPTKYIFIIWDIIVRSIENVFQYLSSTVTSLTLLLMSFLMQFIVYFSPLESPVNNFAQKYTLPLTTFLCMITMLSCTCFVIYVRFGGDNIDKWLQLVKVFEPGIKLDEIEKKFWQKSLGSLITFLIVSLTFLILFPLSFASTDFVDFSAVSFFLMILVDRTIVHQRYYVNISCILNFLTCMYKTNILQNIFATAISYLDLKIIYDITENISMHISCLSCLALPFVLPFIYIKMSFGVGKKGWYLVLLPHFMSVIWMNFGFMYATGNFGSTQFYSVFAWFSVLFASKYLGIVISAIVYLSLRLAINMEAFNFEIIVVVSVFLILYTISTLLVKKFDISYGKKLWSSLICLFILMLSYQSCNLNSFKASNVSDVIIPWENYQAFCYQHGWFRSNPVEKQISCLPFRGKLLSMEGTITTIDIVKVKNKMHLISNILPGTFYHWFVYAFGTGSNCDDPNISQLLKEQCKFFETLNLTHDNLYNWNEYNYRIVLELSTRTSHEITLYAENTCTEFLRSIMLGDSVHVVAKLEKNVGVSNLEFTLKEIRCVSCYLNIVCNTTQELQNLDYKQSLNNIVWFYFSPFIQYQI